MGGKTWLPGCVWPAKNPKKTQVSILGPLCSLPYSFLFNLFHLVGFLESKMIFPSFKMVNLSIYFSFIIHFLYSAFTIYNS